MKITFSNSSIEALCRQQKLAVKTLGRPSAEKLQRRLSELFAANVVSDLIAGRPHPLTHNRTGQFAVDLHKGWRLIFKPTQTPPPTKPDQSINWSEVSAITLIEAEDYHD